MQNRRNERDSSGRYTYDQSEFIDRNPTRGQYQDQEYNRFSSRNDRNYQGFRTDQTSHNYDSDLDEGRIQMDRSNVHDSDYRQSDPYQPYQSGASRSTRSPSSPSSYYGYGQPYGPSFGQDHYNRSPSENWSSQAWHSQQPGQSGPTGRSSHSSQFQGGESLWQQTKNFFGKGPKGFKRSDERIQEEVCEALFRDPSVDASEIEVSVQEGEVTLSGTVTERQMKRMAEDCAESISGVKDVRNEIRVQSQNQSQSQSENKTSTESLTSTNERGQDRSDKTKGRNSFGSSSNKVM